jgi:trans-2,3-dihydro-3-hydroxyanthranilate isomerase
MPTVPTVQLPLDIDLGRTRQPHSYLVVDVFTDIPLEGNQLAVFTDARSFSDQQMQRLAREMNLAETVYILPPQAGGDVRMRIFTPSTELPFAGHPVLGTAFAVGTSLGSDTVRLETGLGVIPVELDRSGGRIVFGWMDQPVPSWQPYERQAELLAALGVEGSLLPVEAYRNGPLHVYVQLDSQAVVAGLRPDFGALGPLGEIGVSCFADADTHWKTRMFAPGLGVREDPATGSAAGPLALHLARHGRVGFGERIEIRQGAEIGRPSVLYAQVEGSADGVRRVRVGGQAVLVARGEFRLG